MTHAERIMCDVEEMEHAYEQELDEKNQEIERLEKRIEELEKELEEHDR